MFFSSEEFPKNIRVAFVFQNRKNDCEMDRNTNTTLSREDMVFPPLDSAPEIPKIRFDCVFVPAIAVNEKQDTIGFGKGYYDPISSEYFCNKKLFLVLKEISSGRRMFFRKHDIPADIIVTEKAIYRIENV